jgi:hypothetical protein
MNRPARPGERRDLRVLRRGAEQGFAQVLTGPELVELLDRLDDAEMLERAASVSPASATLTEIGRGRRPNCGGSLMHRKTSPSDICE